MAKKTAKKPIKKADIIRDVIKGDSSMGPTAVARKAAARLGIEFTPTLVSQASSILKKLSSGSVGNGKAKGQEVGNGKKNANLKEHTIGNGKLSFLNCGRAAAFAQEVGGFETALELLKILKSL